MPKISDILRCLEAEAPLGLQESWDNCGVQVGGTEAECTGALIAVDATPEAVAEAAGAGCNLLITHHPLLFRGLKRITGQSRVERTVIEAIRLGVTVFALHTAIDNAPGGVSWAMARRLGVHHGHTLTPLQGRLMHLTTYVPEGHTEAVCQALFAAGAGAIGRYDRCSFAVSGQGTFRPLEGADPYVGHVGREHYQAEARVEMVVPVWRRRAVEQALLQAHPYETPAYQFVLIDNVADSYGSGVVADLPAPMSCRELAEKVKDAFHTPVARCNRPARGLDDTVVTRVALCGGSGSSFLDDAVAAGADAYITADTSYHHFVDREGSLFIIDIGHYESEACVKEIFYDAIKEKFPTFAVRYAQSERNPIIYI